jgi:hypothetical protein
MGIAITGRSFAEVGDVEIDQIILVLGGAKE